MYKGKSKKSHKFFVNPHNPSLCDIIKNARLTEKSAQDELTNNTISFIVPKYADKYMIRAAVEKVLNSEVKSVRTLTRKGQARTIKGRKVYMSDTKIAFVHVTSLQNIGGALNV